MVVFIVVFEIPMIVMTLFGSAVCDYRLWIQVAASHRIFGRRAVDRLRLSASAADRHDAEVAPVASLM